MNNDNDVDKNCDDHGDAQHHHINGQLMSFGHLMVTIALHTSKPTHTHSHLPQKKRTATKNLYQNINKFMEAVGRGWPKRNGEMMKKNSGSEKTINNKTKVGEC